MKPYLLDIYNEHKHSFAEVIANELMAKGDKIEFSPIIHIDLPTPEDEDFEEIIGIEFDEKENTWYVHNFIIGIDLMTDEYWTPLRDLDFNELFAIAERLD